MRGLYILLALSVVAADWPEWMGGHNREGVWTETGILEKFPPGGPKRLWSTPIGPGYSGPAVVGDRVYVMDRQVPPPAEGEKKASVHRAHKGTERLLCLDAKTGKQVWVHEYPCEYKLSYGSGPRTTPLVRDGRVYMLGAMGDFKCLNAADGKVIWAKNIRTEYKAPVPVWGYAAAPLLDGDLLYTLVGGEDSAIVAFHKDTGKEVWKALTTEEIGYSPPVIVQAGGARQLIVWHSESINSLDPATGKRLWFVLYPAEDVSIQRPAPIIPAPRQMGDLLFIASYYHGPLMLRLAADKPAAEVLYRDKTTNPRKPIGLHCGMSTPLLRDGHIYGICANGELRCCDAKTGNQLWETYAPVGGKKADCGTVFLVPQGDRVVMFNDSGELIFAKLSPKGYEEIDRAKIIEPKESARGRVVVWSHPAFADRKVFVRNSQEIVCVSVAQEGG